MKILSCDSKLGNMFIIMMFCCISYRFTFTKKADITNTVPNRKLHLKFFLCIDNKKLK